MELPAEILFNQTKTSVLFYSANLVPARDELLGLEKG